MIKKLTVLLLSIFVVSVASAQSINDIVINEVLVKNNKNLVDEYGQRNGWIELRNSGYSKINIAGCRLQVDRGGVVTTYKIPKNDPRTIIAPQDFALFYADGVGYKGTFYANFKLDGVNRISFLDASGKNVISEIEIMASQCKADVSMGLVTKVDGEGEVWDILEATTPAATNKTVDVTPRSVLFHENDPNGFAMAIIAMSVVFSALLLLFIVFKRLGYLIVSLSSKKDKNKKTESVKQRPSEMMKGEMKGEVVAAIAIALKQYEEDLHDIESTVMTINHVAKAYSPWSSKIYGVSRQPNK